MKRILFAAAAFAGLVTACAPALAQDGREAQMIGFHDLCDHGDRKACVRFGMMLQQNADRQAEWRHAHPDWFFFEH